MGQWAKPAIPRGQMRLFYPTVEDMIGEDHPVRLFDEILRTQDWREWESCYDGHRGQPPIHPRLMAGAILYGLSLRLRSSRQLEDACRNRLDFKWLLSGLEIDHSTFAKFRTKHEAALVSLFRGLNRLARQMGQIALVNVATDGTRIQANSSRYETASGAKIENWLAGVEEEIRTALAAMATQDKADDACYGEGVTLSKLPQELRKLEQRKELLTQAKAAIEEMERRREAKHVATEEKVAKIPVSDPDSRVLPNKEGGFSPNYTPVVSVDEKAGFIVDIGVTNSTAESKYQVAAVSEMEEVFGQRPDAMLGDGAYGELETVRQLEELGVHVLTTVSGTGAGEGSVAYRPDPRLPVASELLSKLPLTRHSHFTRHAFQYDVTAACFYCPAGKELVLKSRCRHKRSNGTDSFETLVYVAMAEDCRCCPLRDKCITPTQTRRRVERMAGSEVLDRVAERMSLVVNQLRYARRRVIAETPFAHIKHNLGIRRFLHRGLAKVTTEWRWICTAYNMSKLVRIVRSARQEYGMGGWSNELAEVI